MREQTERVQRALQGQGDPLGETIDRLDPALRSRARRYVLLGLLALGGLGTAHETGALALVMPKPVPPASDDLKDVKRLVSWLVRQERNRQVRECLAQPSTPCRIEEPPDPEAEK